MMKINPVGRRLLLQMEPVEETTEAGLILPNAKDEQFKQYKGKVLAIGDGAWVDIGDGTPWCKEGDYILFQAYSGAKISDDPNDLRILINDLDVLAVVEGDSNA